MKRLWLAAALMGVAVMFTPVNAKAELVEVTELTEDGYVTSFEEIETEEFSEEELLGATLLDAPKGVGLDFKKGIIKFSRLEKGEGRYCVKLEMKNSKLPPVSTYYRFGISDTKDVEIQLSGNMAAALETGEWNVKVFAVDANHKPISKEGTLPKGVAYTKPKQSLKRSETAGWVDTIAEWAANSNKGYEIQLDYCPSIDGNYRMKCMIGGGRNLPKSITYRDLSDYLKEKGYYRFRVRFLSGDLTANCDSEWSPWSSILDTERLTGGLEASLETRLNDSETTPTEIKEFLKNQDKGKVITSIMANSRFADMMETLEAEYAKENSITVKPTQIDAPSKIKIKGDVKISGAALNAPDGVTELGLVISETDPTFIKAQKIDKNRFTDMIQISMDIPELIETKELDIPVKITMPIPEGISPSLFRILHFGADHKTYEIIVPEIIDGNAVFCLKHFSEFVLASAAPSPFDDVNEKSWYFNDVKAAYEAGLMSGTAERTFNPDGTMSRGMVAAVLYRMAGSPEVEFTATFSDVTSLTPWYAKGILWAAKQGIVSGYKDGSFGVNDDITREQLCSMICLYAKNVDSKDVSDVADISGYPDAAQVAGYAKNAMGWAVKNGIVSGKVMGESTCLAPKANAKRCECAAIIMRYKRS